MEKQTMKYERKEKQQQHNDAKKL